MPINPAIALGLQPQQAPDILGTYGNALNLRNLVNAGRMQDMQMAQAQRAQEKELRIADLARDSQGDVEKFMRGYGEIDPMGAMDYGLKISKAQGEAKKLGIETQGKQLENAEKLVGLNLKAARFVAERGYTPEAVAEAKAFLASSGVPAETLSQVPDNPSREYVDGIIAANLSESDRIAKARLAFEQATGNTELGRLLYLQDRFRGEQGQGVDMTIGDAPTKPQNGDIGAPAITLRNLATPYDSAIARIQKGDVNDPFRMDERGNPVANAPVQDFQVRRAREGATRVSVDTKQQDASAKKIGEGMGEQFMEIQRAEFNSRRRVDRVSRLQNLLQDVDTGKLTPIGTQLAGYAKSLGFDIDPKLGNKEAAIALENEIALELRNPSGGAGMPGAMSDSDRRFLQNMAAFTDKTPKGRQMMVDTLKKIAERDAQVSKMARDYKKRNGGVFDEGFYDELAVFSAANPLFPTQEQINNELKKRGR